ncbi:MAG: TonB-dependent receptor plug domain-containing protein [Opitutaceae bacterium]
MNATLRLLVCGPLAALLTGPGLTSLTAQTAPAKDEPVQLSPFRIDTSKDKGYLATNAVSGTRLNTAIKDLPMPIEVVTSEFIRDIGASDMKDALAFSAGIYGSDNFTAESGGPGLFDFSPSRPTNKPLSQLPTAVNIRGFYTGTQLRLGFRNGTQFDATVLGAPVDAVDIDRAEVVRGPAALLYGVSTLGGVVNILPKMPSPKRRYEVSQTFGTFDYSRTTIDATGPLLADGTLNYRVLGTHQSGGAETDFYELNVNYLAGKLEWRPFKHTSVYGEYLWQDSKQEGLGFGASTTNRDIFDNNDTTLARNRYNELYNWTRDGGGLTRRTFNLAGPDTFERNKTWSTLLQLEQRIFEGLTFVAGYQFFHSDITQRRILSQQTLSLTSAQYNQVPDQSLLTIYPNGQAKVIRYDWDNDPFDVDSEQYRVELTYKFALGSTNHNLLVGRQSTRDQVFRPNNNPTIQNTSTNAGLVRTEFRKVTDYSPIRYDGTTYERARDTTQWNWFDGDYAVYNGKFFSDRLTLIAGGRHDRFASRVLDFDYVGGVRNALPTNPDNGPGTPRVAAAPQRAGYRFGGRPQTETTGTLGLNYKINPSVSVYALTAQGLFPNPGQRDGASRNFDAETTLSEEVGVKVDLLGGKISGTLSGFRIRRENATYFYSNAPAPRANYAPSIDLVANNANFNPTQPRTFAVRSQYFPAGYTGTPAASAGYFLVNYETLGSDAVGKAAMEAAFRDTQTTTPINYGDTASNNPNRGRGSDVSYEEESSGIDAQVIFSLKPNWQVITSFAHIVKEVSDGFSLVDAVDLNDGKNYGTEYDAWLYELGRENFSDPKRASTWNRQSIVGKTLDLGPKQTASFFSNYKFEQGALKNLSVRIGAIYTGSRPTTVDFGGGNTNVNLLRTPDTSSRIELRGGFGYQYRSGRQNWRFNLSIDNLLGDVKDETVTSYALSTGTTERRQISYFRPRNIRFSASLDL